MPQQQQQQQPHETRAALPSADARATRTQPDASASAAPAVSPASPHAVQPGNAQSLADLHAANLPVAARTVRFSTAPSQPQPSAFNTASRPDIKPAEASPSAVPAQLPAQHSPAASPDAMAGTAQAAVRHDGDAVLPASPSSRPVVHSHAAPGDDPLRPSAAEAAENQAHAADPLRLESLELKLSAAAAQRRPRTLRPRRPRTPEIADSAQLGAEQVLSPSSWLKRQLWLLRCWPKDSYIEPQRPILPSFRSLVPLIAHSGCAMHIAP